MSKPASSLTTEAGAGVGLARKAVPETCGNGLRIAPAGASAAAASMGKRERTRAVARALGPPEVLAASEKPREAGAEERPASLRHWRPVRFGIRRQQREHGSTAARSR